MRLRAEEARSIVYSSGGNEDLKHLLLLIHTYAVKGMLSYRFNSNGELDSGLKDSLHDLGYGVFTEGDWTTISW